MGRASRNVAILARTRHSVNAQPLQQVPLLICQGLVYHIDALTSSRAHSANIFTIAFSSLTFFDDVAAGDGIGTTRL